MTEDIKVSELTGAQLDYWVARAAGVPLDAYGDRLDVLESYGSPRFRPSTNWAQGGLIIEEMAIGISCTDADTLPRFWMADVPNGSMALGPSPLIAAMRAYVGSKYGDTVPECPL